MTEDQRVRDFLERTKDMDRLDTVRELMKDDPDKLPIPILHNKDVILLQFHGWSVNLQRDGSWWWEDTSGG
jgi:hypothetical protein